MKTKSLILTAMLGATATLSAQDAPADVVPATETTPAAETASAPLKLADLDPAVRAYALEAIALALEANATYFEKASLEEIQSDPNLKMLLPLVVGIFEKNSTEALPAPIKGFVDEFSVLAKQMYDELMLTDLENDGAIDTVMAKYEAPAMAIVQKYPEAVALGMQIAGSLESLSKELELDSIIGALVAAGMQSAGGEAPNPKDIAPILRDAATKMRAKK